MQKGIFLGCCILVSFIMLSGCRSESADYKSLYNPTQDLSVPLGIEKDAFIELWGEPAHISSKNGSDEFYIYYDQDYNESSFLFSQDYLRSICTYSPQYETMDGVKPGSNLTELSNEWNVTIYGSTIEKGTRGFDEDGLPISTDNQNHGSVVHRLEIIDDKVFSLTIEVN